MTCEEYVMNKLESLEKDYQKIEKDYNRLKSLSIDFIRPVEGLMIIVDCDVDIPLLKQCSCVEDYNNKIEDGDDLTPEQWILLKWNLKILMRDRGEVRK